MIKKNCAALLLLLALLMPKIMNAQSVRLYLSVPDESILTSISSSGVPSFALPSIASVFSQYGATNFAKAFPDSRFDFMRHIYSVNCTSTALGTTLKASWPAYFPYYEEDKVPQYTGNYYPNDWGLWYDKYLDFIHAPAAWGITKGDTGTVIGITDTYFDLNNPDLQGGQIKRITNNYPPPYNPATGSFDAESWHHGTTVAGIAAGRTDNSTGFPSVGFNCRLDLAEGQTGEMQRMADRGCQVLNGSWGGFAGFDLTQAIQSNLTMQMQYQGIYEEGTFSVFGAGNGDNHTPGAAGQYFIPAALDHVMSVSAVGWENNYGSGSTFNVKWVHEANVGDSVADCYQHNSQVDICAPAVRIGGLTCTPIDTSKHFEGIAGWGTSFASPQVAGTAALLHSFNNCYSPYQLEWLLKKTANDSMFKVPENNRYAGRLGAGALDAGNALTFANTYKNDVASCNNPATQTMFVQGVEVNTICAPGYSSNSTLPHLKPVVLNGTPPYSARWVALGGNTATLSSINTFEPDVTAATGGKLLYYRLTVYDSDPVAKKVADKIIRIQLDTVATYDLALRDSYVDMLDQPNSQLSVDGREWDIWHSPDLWVRQVNDSITEHQNPEYLNNDSNYIYVRVRNIGCAAASSNTVEAGVKLYWTQASTGEMWDADWTGMTYLAGSSGVPVVAGSQIGNSLPVPPLQPGASVVLHTAWKPQRPQDYINSPDKVDVCLLARIIEDVFVSTPFGGAWYTKDMDISELFLSEKYNVKNNNNIVTRNLIITNFDLTNKPTEKHQIWVSNAETENHVFNLQLINDKAIHKQLAGDFSAVGYITLHLGDLFDRWVAAGSLGTYAHADETAKTVTFDGATTLELDGIQLNSGEHFPVIVEISLRNGAKTYGNSFDIHFRQFMVNEKTVDPDVYGNVSFHINTPVADHILARKQNPANEQSKINKYFVYPNPVGDVLNYGYAGSEDVISDIMVTDVTGRAVIVKKNTTMQNRQTYTVSTAGLQSGIYIVHFTNNKGATETFKITKLN
ncbi:S8/S53 family peptidase [Chitinophaga polysaccharea]|uniref:S8/S53 family peptidase n=1 Tax=Chitinophaga polysaccharea TaxID=1293035 RepID=UPI00115910E4|nr:S8/S53 family peptidase [Chitinophaga polysaccharea]